MASYDAQVVDPMTLGEAIGEAYHTVFYGDETDFNTSVGPSYQDGYDDGFEDGELAGYDEGYDDGYLEGNHTDFVYAGAVVAVTAQDYAGLPLTGLTPTFSVYLNAATGVAQAAPTVNESGGGHYNFSPTGAYPCGILTLGGASHPRYFLYNAMSPYFVFAAYDEEGQPLSGQVPVWLNLKKVSDGSNVSQPAITELSGGLYKTTMFSEHVAGIIDLGSACFPRYIPYDSENLMSYHFVLGYYEGTEADSVLVVDHNTAKTVSVRTINASTGLPFVVNDLDLAAATVSLKKSGGAFATITPVLTKRNTFVDVALTSTHLNTLGIADLVLDIPSSISPSLKMDVRAAPQDTAILAAIANVDSDIAAVEVSIDGVETNLGAAISGVATDVDAVQAAVANVDADVASVKSDTASTLSSIGSMVTMLTELHKIGVNRWKVANNQLTIYDNNGTTPLRVYDLLDEDGQPTMTKIFERVES